MSVATVPSATLTDLLAFSTYWLNKIRPGLCKEICTLDDYIKPENATYMCPLFAARDHRGDSVVQVFLNIHTNRKKFHLDNSGGLRNLYDNYFSTIKSRGCIGMSFNVATPEDAWYWINHIEKASLTRRDKSTTMMTSPKTRPCHSSSSPQNNSLGHSSTMASIFTETGSVRQTGYSSSARS